MSVRVAAVGYAMAAGRDKEQLGQAENAPTNPIVKAVMTDSAGNGGCSLIRCQNIFLRC